jgi:hypothetical protein
MIGNLNHPVATEALSRREQAVHDHMQKYALRAEGDGMQPRRATRVLAWLRVPRSRPVAAPLPRRQPAR